MFFTICQALCKYRKWTENNKHNLSANLFHIHYFAVIQCVITKIVIHSEFSSSRELPDSLFKIKILWRNRLDTILLHSENILITISLQSPFLTKFQNGFSGLFIPLKSRLNYLDLLGNLILNYSHLLSKLISPTFGLLVRTEIISYYSG